jgi:hypothetical protein
MVSTHFLYDMSMDVVLRHGDHDGRRGYAKHKNGQGVVKNVLRDVELSDRPVERVGVTWLGQGGLALYFSWNRPSVPALAFPLCVAHALLD